MGESKRSQGKETSQILYHINGIKVHFPVKAYPTQISMMHKILSGLEKRQNCLLESPTGSGKSLALLCSCLAWQQHEKDRIALEDLEDLDKASSDAPVKITGCTDAPNKEKPCEEKVLPGSVTECNTSASENAAKQISSEFFKSIKFPAALPNNGATDGATQSMENVAGKNEAEDEDFQPTKKRFRVPATGPAPKAKRMKMLDNGWSLSDEEDPSSSPPRWTMESTAADDSTLSTAEEQKASNTTEKNGKDKEKEKRRSLPKIFFGTRTHKQIAQIIRELKKTVFKEVRMTILSSREHTCIHPVVSKSRDKNEECKRLVKGIDGSSCKFHSNASTLARLYKMGRSVLDPVWDIEDLIAAGRKGKACPYFAARELMKDVEIVFCPYNYLVDPLIRSQMDIVIKDQIVVLDEAHNIEDSSRDAASLTVTGVQLSETIEELDHLVSAGILEDAHRALHLLCSNLQRWMEKLDPELKQRGFEEACKTFTGQEMVLNLKSLSITPMTLRIFKEQFSKLLAAELDPSSDRNDELKLGSKSLSLLRGIMLVLENLLNEEKNYVNDYHIVVTKSAVMMHRPIHLGGGWKRRSANMEKVWTFTLNFWCLNPAVVFSEIGSSARCIVLTSGTLSPMSSFSSELGVQFPIKLEANHVINDSQVWAGALLVGPQNAPINASFKGSETFAFQDDIGQLLLQVCKVISHGVLCFFPSYYMIEKLSRRWQATGLWSKLETVKVIVTEPRSTERHDFDAILKQYYDCVRMNLDSVDQEYSTLTGALLLAVCRGKVSEGLDFSDENARCVITVGIPFPSTKDSQVELKRKYNTKYAASHGLLNGNEWYEIQAYRALNQALGRCIRHRNDWGALLLVDERFGKSEKYVQGLSKWVRHRVEKYGDFQVCLSSLADFADSRQSNAENSSIFHSPVVREVRPYSSALPENVTTCGSAHVPVTPNRKEESANSTSPKKDEFEAARNDSVSKCSSLSSKQGEESLAIRSELTNGYQFVSQERLKFQNFLARQGTAEQINWDSVSLRLHGIKNPNDSSFDKDLEHKAASCAKVDYSSSNGIAKITSFCTFSKATTPCHSTDAISSLRRGRKSGFVYPNLDSLKQGQSYWLTSEAETVARDCTAIEIGTDRMQGNVSACIEDVLSKILCKETNVSRKSEVVTGREEANETVVPTANPSSDCCIVKRDDESPLLFPIPSSSDAESTPYNSNFNTASFQGGDNSASSVGVPSNSNPKLDESVTEQLVPKIETAASCDDNKMPTSCASDTSCKKPALQPDSIHCDVESTAQRTTQIFRTKRNSISKRTNLRVAGRFGNFNDLTIAKDEGDSTTDLSGSSKKLFHSNKVAKCKCCGLEILCGPGQLKKLPKEKISGIKSISGQLFSTHNKNLKNVSDLKVQTVVDNSGKGEKLQLNAIYEESTATLYRPLVCQYCLKRDAHRVVAFQVIATKSFEPDNSRDKDKISFILVGENLTLQDCVL